ncbi:MAG: tetratricopeptide repeat protein, partial [Limnothrix sp. CACIAM 69d]
MSHLSGLVVRAAGLDGREWVMDWDDEEDLPPETPEEIYQNLRRSLQRQTGFELHFIVCDRNKDEELFDRLRREIPEKRFAQLVLDRKATTLLDQVQALAETTAFDVLFVRDLDEALLDYEDTKRQAGWSDVQIYSVDWRGVPPILQHLNWARETLRDRFPCAFVICCRPTTIQYLSERAPDFFDWRLGVYRFPLKPSEIDQKILEESLAEDSYQNLTESECISKLMTLQDLIKNATDFGQLSQLYLQVGKLNLSAGNYGLAIINFARVLDLDSTNYSAAFFQGNALLSLGRYEEAVMSYEKAIQLEPKYHHIFEYTFRNRRQLIFDLKWCRTAIGYLVHHLQNITNYYKIFQEINFQKYKHLFSVSRQYRTTLDRFIRIVQRKPNYHYIWRNRGNALLHLGRYEEAITSYQRAIEIDLNDLYSHNELGNAYHDLKRYEEAITSHQRAIQVDPSYIYAHNDLGAAYRDLKRYEEAITAYQRAIKLDPNYASPHNNLGNAYRDLKRYEEAITAYQRAIKLDPNYASPHNNLG